MGRTWLIAALLTALAPTASASPAAPGSATLAPSAAAGAPMLKICRLPGSPSEFSERPIAIPAGAVFSADAFDDAPAGALDPRDTAPLQIAITASVSIAPAKFCVDAPVKPLGGAGAGALRAALGRMFVATGGAVQRVDAGSLDGVYGLLHQPGN